MKQNNILRIERPKLMDAEGIAKIAESLRLNLEKVYPNGFLLYPKNTQWYQDRIREGFEHKGDYFYVAREGEHLVGYILGTEGLLLPEYIQKGLVTCPETAQHLYNRTKHFVFGEQIGVIPDCTRKGIGSRLLEHLTKEIDAKSERILVNIAHAPVKNEASINFCRHEGFSLLHEFSNSDGSLWGIYERGLR